MTTGAVLFGVAKTAAELQAEKEAVAFVLAMLLIGIAVVGVILLVLIVLWGGRTRRISREGLPEVREPDPFAAMRAETRKNLRGAPVSEESPTTDASSTDGEDSNDSDEPRERDE